MKVLIVSQYFWPESFRINDVAAGLREKGHDVTVLTGKPNYPTGHFYEGYGFFSRIRNEYQGIKLVRVPILPRGKKGIFRLALNYLSYAVSASILAPFYCRERYDCVLVYQMSPVIQALPAIVLKKIYGSPVFFWVQDLWPESLSAVGAIKNSWVLRQLEKLVGYLYRSSDKVLIQSKAFYDHVSQHHVADENILYYPNSAEDLYRPVEMDPQSSLAELIPDGFVVMFAGNVGEAQDMPGILRAAELTRDNKSIHWVILGDGRKSEWLIEQIQSRDLSDTVHYLGRYPVDRMPAFFSYADAMLVSLTRDPIFASTIPAKVQSYLACGKPVIAALDGEGAKVINESGAGIAPGSENPEKLADAVRHMASLTEDEMSKMGENAKSYYMTHFHRDMLLDRLISWVEQQDIEDTV